MSVIKQSFGTTGNGLPASLYVIDNGKSQISVTDYGATLVSVVVPDRNGVMADVALGFDSVTGYETSNYQGATVGPYCNRIAGGKFSIDGAEYDLVRNENGVTNLHSGGELTRRLWTAEVFSEDDMIRFSISREDSVNGYPGNMDLSVTYKLADPATVIITYGASADRKTFINLTNHSYFNLGGFDSGSIEGTLLKICADRFTPVDENSIPTGELLDVAGTPFDFTSLHAIGERINDENEQLALTGGYDHNYAIRYWDGSFREAAFACDPVSGRTLTVLTTLPGVQFYAGNFLKGTPGKEGKPMTRRSGFCLETQYYPDTPNHPDFPQCLYDENKTYSSVTSFCFGHLTD
ncbi:MAG: galactose mutarotase [Clostridia bacterium]|nr:galactose mutarotase [Clostridia bacterium]